MNQKKKHICLLGSTGSIGTQALEVIRAHPEKFVAEVLVAKNNSDLLIKQALEFKPNAVVMVDPANYLRVKEALYKTDTKVYAGAKSIAQVIDMGTIDMVLAAIVGYAGLESTLAAIKAGKNIALANKETLVVAGDLITRSAKEKGVNIYPVDSEHSAIFQCLAGEWHNPVEKIFLTASGGPFRGWTKEQLEAVTPEEALKHPNWNMGAKVTIDSATLMNKGLEVIEAKWLFGLDAKQIEVLVHPQSIIHSMVQFTDGSIKAQLGLPDMRLPIQYAFSYPERLSSSFPRMDFEKQAQLTFEAPDRENFPCLGLAYHALEKGGNSPCVLNAANEVAVEAFLQGKIPFVQIASLVEKTLTRTPFIANPDISDYIGTDQEARRFCQSIFSSPVV
jgi:1-deoxy-D-xylulose-5-phosphate reductoisomerase